MNPYRTGQEVRVFMGSQWEKGTFVREVGGSLLVQLPRRLVRVWDPRNVKTLSDKRKGAERLR